MSNNPFELDEATEALFAQFEQQSAKGKTTSNEATSANNANAQLISKLRSEFSKQMYVTRTLNGLTQFLQGMPVKRSVAQVLLDLMEAQERGDASSAYVAAANALAGDGRVKCRIARNCQLDSMEAMQLRTLLQGELAPRSTFAALAAYYDNDLERMGATLVDIDSIKGSKVGEQLSLYAQTFITMVLKVADALGVEWEGALDYLYPDKLRTAQEELKALSMEILNSGDLEF